MWIKDIRGNEINVNSLAMLKIDMVENLVTEGRFSTVVKGYPTLKEVDGITLHVSESLDQAQQYINKLTVGN